MRILRRATGALSAVTLLLSMTGSAEAAFVRAPWIQDARQDRVAVYWQAGASGGTQQFRWGSSDLDHTTDGTLVSGALYKAVVTGLTASTRYRYQVDSGSDVSAEGSFGTAPDRAEPFRFGVYGDNRTNATPHAAVVAEMIHQAPEFVINTGDIVDATNYTQFFSIEKDLLRDIPIFPSPGNHDVASQYQTGFDRPKWYAVRWGNALFLSISTDDSYASGSTQYAWVDAQLAAATQDPTIQWIFAFHHYPVYSSGANHGSTADMQGSLNVLYKKYGVDAVFNGHDHIYERIERDGIEYFVAGGGGAPLYSVSTPVAGSQAAKSVNNVVTVDIDGGVLDLNAWDTNGTRIDGWHLEKGPRSGSDPTTDPTPPAGGGAFPFPTAMPNGNAPISGGGGGGGCDVAGTAATLALRAPVAIFALAGLAFARRRRKPISPSSR